MRGGREATARRANPSRAALATTPTPPEGPDAADHTGTTLSREAAGLAEVQRALREGRAAAALSLLDAQEPQFRAGKLQQERQAARVIALCAEGKSSEARALAERFLAEQPSSPLAARLRNTCFRP